MFSDTVENNLKYAKADTKHEDIKKAIQNADIIVVMNNGRIAEIRNHDTLISQKVKYYDLYMTQYKGFEI